ncbi:hypothetical protein ABZ468_43400 [Streptomyces sp. NPDC005708]|uniref:hypothetical protein n=1 Tax=unclassified Streptomyces TaxID=2593676 RepID=UPI0033ED5EC2
MLLAHQHRHAVRVPPARLVVAGVDRQAAHRDELRTPAGHRVGDQPDPAVRRHDDLELAPGDGLVERLSEVRVGMEVLVAGELVRAAVQEGGLVPARGQAADEVRAGPSDHECPSRRRAHACDVAQTGWS